MRTVREGKMVQNDREGLPATIVSGGQTGVDRAALDFAAERGYAMDGWCPKERRAEDGPIPARYPLRETPTRNYPERTAWNVRDSDGTLVLCRGALSGGTALTVECAENQRKPYFVIDLEVVREPEVEASAGDSGGEGLGDAKSGDGTRRADPGSDDAVAFLGAGLRDWLERHDIRTLNVAGPRESGAAGIYEEALQFLRSAL